MSEKALMEKSGLASTEMPARTSFFSKVKLLIKSESSAKFLSLVTTSVLLFCLDYYFLRQVRLFNGFDQTGSVARTVTFAVMLFPVFFSFWFSLKSFKFYKMMLDLPTSKIRSAAQGLVELSGVAIKACQGPDLLTPYTRESAIWRQAKTIYTQRIKTNTGYREVSRVVSRLEDKHLCAINDGTGVAYFCPSEAKLQGVRESTLRRGQYTYHEQWIEPDAPIYLVGTLTTMDKERFVESLFPEPKLPTWWDSLRISLGGKNPYNRTRLDQKDAFLAMDSKRFNLVDSGVSGAPYFISHKDESLMLTEYRFWGYAFAALGIGVSGLILSTTVFS